MIQPKIPANPMPTGAVIPLEGTVHPAAPCECRHPHTLGAAPAPVPARPAVQLTPASALALVAGGAGVVLVIGAVLVSLLLAVAVTAASLAITALVIRSLMTQHHKQTKHHR